MTVLKAVMRSPVQIAKRDKISKQAVSKKVRALAEKHGLEVERGARGAIVKVNIAQYDLLRERLDDPSKVQRPSPPAADDPMSDPPVADPESYNEAIRNKTWYEAELKRLALDEQIGKLIRVDDFAIAIDDCGAEIVAIVRRLQNETDGLAAVVARDGAHGLRVAMKQIESGMLGEIANSLKALAQRGPAKTAEDQPSAQ